MDRELCYCTNDQCFNNSDLFCDEERKGQEEYLHLKKLLLNHTLYSINKFFNLKFE